MTAYGYSAYKNGFLYRGKIYPLSKDNLYGLSLYTPFNVSPFTAEARDYATITLRWQTPDFADGAFMGFRLIASRYGFPVDENDGNILIDSAVFPGTAYVDLDVIPGQYHYYGIYLLNQGIWNRAGLAWCLPPFDYASGTRMFSLLPPYYQELADTELTQTEASNTTLATFLNVIGWGLDQLRTQYDMLARHLNEPMLMPLGDLVNLCGEIGLPFQPEMPASIMRKAAANWTHVAQERGTMGGIAEQITLLTGYDVDLRAGANLMLEQDQAIPADPLAIPWNVAETYRANDLVTYLGFVYQWASAGTTGPTGTSAANTFWTAVQGTADPNSTLANAKTVGGLNTWEGFYPLLAANTATPSGTLVNLIGLPDPLSMTSHTHNAYTIVNKSGGTTDMALRSVSRIAADINSGNTHLSPDPIQPVLDGVPVPLVDPGISAWDSSVRYATDTTVVYQGLLYRSLRASTGATPPSPGQPLNQNYGFETTVSPWAGFHGATVAKSSVQAFQGTSSMKVTPDGVTTQPEAVSESITIIPGAIYVASGWVFCATASQTAIIDIDWFDPFGTYISSSDQTVPLTASVWTECAVAAFAPANAVTANMYVGLTGTPASSVVSYWDDLDLECSQTPEWCVLSPDNRLRLMLSGYTAQSFSTTANQQVQVTPFIEWFDSTGHPIVSNGQTRVTPRTASAGTPGIAPNLTFDSFSTGNATLLNGRETDTEDQPWTTMAGSWSVSSFAGGTVFPAAGATQTFAALTGLATGCNIGVTFVTAPPAGQDAGIVFRAASISSYWRAGMSGLYKVTAGSSVLSGSYSTACQPGDRLVVNLNGNVITVYRNGAQVLQVTDSYNASATEHGIAVENTGI